ncbi:hypothetical protein F4780DRAFT_785135 [Xylariomycetidae sp. FL0641]|nr:hypothetical protein F4780DRAFT_785135 [Xylariomycetidae sp. FL0641]
MAAGIIEAVGFLSGVLGIVGFAQDNFAAEADAVASVVRIRVGLDTEGGLSNAGGDLPDVRLFNEAGGVPGHRGGPGQGGGGRVRGTSRWPTRTATPTETRRTRCSRPTTTPSAGGARYTWDGQWGRRCSGTWYYSNVYITGTDEKPRLPVGSTATTTSLRRRRDPVSPATTPASRRPSSTIHLQPPGPQFKMLDYPDQDPPPRSIDYRVPQNPDEDDDDEDDDKKKRSVGTAAYGPPPSASSPSPRRTSGSHGARAAPAPAAAAAAPGALGRDQHHHHDDASSQ